MNVTVQGIPCGAYEANAFLICAPNREDCILIDPGDDLERLRTAIARSGRTLVAILLTHGHFDHILAVSPLAKETGATVYIHEGDMEMLNDSILNSYNAMVCVLPAPGDIIAEPLEETLETAGVHIRVLNTPGHSRGSCCFYLEEEKLLFSGDTLFYEGFGRMDLHGGSPAQMRESLRRLFELPGEVKVYCGHGASTTIAVERARYRL